MNTISLLDRPWLRLWLLAALAALLGSLMIAPAAGAQSAPLAQATSPLKSAAAPESPLGSCPPGETEEMIWPALEAVDPATAHPGDTVEVSGRGGYIHCSGGLYDESARSFDLTLDGQALGTIGCYVNHCQTSVAIPADMAPGEHTIATEGGSHIAIQILQARTMLPVMFLPAVVRGAAQPVPDARVSPISGPPISGCPANETATLIPPTLQMLNPSSVAPGGSVRVMGSGGYVRCSGGLYNESARSFFLSFNGEVIAQLGCYANHCEGTLAVPAAAKPGSYPVSTLGGSQLPLVVQ